MGVSGLAEGFLAGFNTMDSYQRGQKEDARQERELGLRDAMWQNAQEQQKKDDVRYEDETKYNRGRHKVDDDRWNLEYAGRQKQLELDNKRANAMLSLDAQRNKMAQESHALAVEKNKRDLWELDNGPAANVAILALTRGEQLTPQQSELLNHKYMTGRNPLNTLVDRGWHEASGRAFGSLKNLLNNPDARGWDGRKLYEEINTDQNRKDFTYLFKNDLSKSLGAMTPNGTVKAYDNLSIVPTGKGTFYFDATVTYADQKTGKDVVMEHVPITEGRTGDPKDPVWEFTGDQLIKHIGQGFQFSQYAQKNPQQVDDYLTQMGLKTPPDYKGLKTALADLHKQEAKALADGGDPATVKAAFDEARESLPSVYGVGSGGVPSAVASGVNPEQWSQSNPERQQFRREAEQGGWLGSYLESPEKMDGAFALWRQAVAKEEAAKQAAVSAEKVRNMEGGKNQPHNYRAAEEAAVNAVIAPFANGQPTLNKAPDGASAYQAMSLAQARR